MNGRFLSILLITSERSVLAGLADPGSSPRPIDRCKKRDRPFLEPNLKRLILLSLLMFGLDNLPFEAFESQKSNQCLLLHLTFFSGRHISLEQDQIGADEKWVGCRTPEKILTSRTIRPSLETIMGSVNF
jgi:hypothetical protein